MKLKFKEMKQNHKLTEYEETKEAVISNYIKPCVLKEMKKPKPTQQIRFSKR